MVFELYEDQKGRLWISSSGAGLTMYDGTTFINWKNQPYNNKSLPGNDVFCIYEDKSGMLWAGTISNGVAVSPSLGQSKFFHLTSENRALPDNNINVIRQDNSGIIWISNNLGIHAYSLNNGRFQLKRMIKNKDLGLGGIPNENMFISGDSTFWFSSNKAPGLLKYNPKTGQAKRFYNDPDNPKSILSNLVNCMLEDNRKRLWIGTYSGLSLYQSPKKGEDHFVNIAYSFDRIKGLPNNSITTMIQDSDSVFWIGTEKGLSRMTLINENAPMFKNFFKDDTDINTLSHDNITTLFKDSKGRIWVGTTGGLNKLINNKNISFKHFTVKEGLPSNSIYKILEDENGMLWMSTSHGLLQFDPDAETFQNYDIDDGLQGNDFNLYAAAKSNDGALLFGGPNGLNIFYPQKLRKNSFIPQVVITDFTILNKDVPIKADGKISKHISLAREINLTYPDNIFSFEFAALDFHAPRKNQYAYMLQGFDEEWTYSGNRNSVQYTNLDAGIYIFKVKASNSDGVWNEQGKSILIHIAPPPWKTWWAYLLYIIAILTILWFIRRFEMKKELLESRLRIQKIEAEKLREIDQMKSHFFANISHEFRTPLTLIVSPLQQFISDEAYAGLNKPFKIMLKNAQRLLKLINQLLDLSRINAGKMKLRASKQEIEPLALGLFFPLPHWRNKNILNSLLRRIPK